MYFPVSALLIEFMILSIVNREDSYGYEISQTIKLVADIKESTLYPILKKLEKAKGAVLIETIGKTMYTEILQELQLLDRQQIKVLGGIMVEE